jgi:hypothetical protein
MFKVHVGPPTNLFVRRPPLYSKGSTKLSGMKNSATAFNPYNFQTGSVWPHDNSMIAMSFKSHGFAAEAARIATWHLRGGHPFSMKKVRMFHYDQTGLMQRINF